MAHQDQQPTPPVAPQPQSESVQVYADPANKAVIIQFGRKIEWLGISVNDAMALRNAIEQQIRLIEKHVRENPPKPQAPQKSA